MTTAKKTPPRTGAKKTKRALPKTPPKAGEAKTEPSLTSFSSKAIARLLQGGTMTAWRAYAALCKLADARGGYPISLTYARLGVLAGGVTRQSVYNVMPLLRALGLVRTTRHPELREICFALPLEVARRSKLGKRKRTNR